MSPEAERIEACERAFLAGERGDLVAVEAAHAALADAGDTTLAAWRVALGALRAALGGAGAAPGPADVDPLVEGPPAARDAIARACALGARGALLAFDGAGLRAWLARHRRVAREDADDRAGLELGAAWLWEALTGDGGAAGDAAAARRLRQRASRAGVGAVVVEAATLEAALLARDGDADAAIEAARRACRMAQAEAMPLPEYLAHLVLARLRRRVGRPHLALHVTAALARVAPPWFHPWLAWEMRLAGAAAPPAPAGDVPAAAAARALGALLNAAAGGDRRRFDEAAPALRAACAGRVDVRREADALVAGLDLDAPAPDEVARWRAGDSDELPAGLHGVTSRPDPSGGADRPLAWVLARPGERGARMLAAGARLAAAGGARLLDHEGGLRTRTGLAALALAGPAGLERERFFASVYGFPFVAVRHQDMLDTLVARMRDLLGDAGTIARAESPALSLELALASPVLVPDMRCVLPVADHALQAIAAAGARTAQDAAAMLRMPLRSVQRLLQQLVDDGALAPERDGRRVVYRLVDTTFTTITRAR